MVTLENKKVIIDGNECVRVNFPERQKLPEGYVVFYLELGSYGIAINGESFDQTFCDKYDARRCLLNTKRK